MESLRRKIQETLDSFLAMSSSNPNPLVRAKLEKFGKRAGKVLLITVGIAYAAWEVWNLTQSLRRYLRRRP